MALINLKRPRNVSSGVADYVLLAPLHFFSSIKSPKKPFELPGDGVTIKETHTFKEGFGWLHFRLAPEKNQLDATTIGDKGFQKLSKDLNIVLPGSYAEQHDVIRELLNTPIIAIIKDSNCSEGIWYQVGTECVPAYLRSDFTTGTTREGIKGYTAAIQSTNGSILLYAGEPTPEISEEQVNNWLTTEDGQILTTEDEQGLIDEG